MQQSYITSHGAFLPGSGVSNDDMEARLGFVGGKPSRYRSRILEANGITNRHYAIDETGNIGPSTEPTNFNVTT